jgi:hypothetical protein
MFLRGEESRGDNGFFKVPKEGVITLFCMSKKYLNFGMLVI